MPRSETFTNNAALMVSQHGEILTWNGGCEALFGRTAAAAIGQPFWSLLTQHARDAFARPLSEHPSACDARSVDIVRARGNGTAELTLIPAYGPGGVETGSIAFFTADADEPDSALVGRMPLRSVIDILPGPFYVIRPDGTFALWNRMLEQAAGMSPEQVSHANALDMYDIDEKPVIAAKMAEVFERHAEVFVEALYRDTRGKGTPFLLCGAPLACHGHEYLCGMGLDISAQRAQEEQLRLYGRAMHAANNGLVITGCGCGEHPIEYVNPAFERITGYSAAEVIGRDARFMAVPGLDQTERTQLHEALRQRSAINVVFRNRRKNGDIFWNDLSITPVQDGHGKVSHFIGVINDVTALKQRTDHLEHEVNHDALTGLANRTLLWDRLQQALHVAQRNKTLVATVLLDLNGFKQINDSHGHEAGDAVLKIVAARLLSAVRESDTVARLSGDEFVLVLVNQPSLRNIMRMLECLRLAVNRPAMIGGASVLVGASMGVSVFPHDGANAIELIRAADTAMYKAKSSKQNEVQFFSQDMKSAAEAKQKLEHDMGLALENNELFLLYQPKVCLTSGRIRGLEALLRWRHPELGVMLPGAFLADAEENGMIIPFGNHVLDQACAFMQRMRGDGLSLLPVSVNVSYREFSRLHYTEHVAATLARTGLAPSSLELELREEGLNKHRDVGLNVLAQLRELGVERTVDAFGAGLSDLHFLQQLPLSRLKIARAAVQQIDPQGHGGGFAKALIDVGHDLGLAVIAKGVETKAQMEFLKANNCDQLQGMFFSEPLPEPALRALLA